MTRLPRPILLLLEVLRDEGIDHWLDEDQPLAPAHLAHCDAADWGRLAAVMRRHGWRWAAEWAEDFESYLLLTALLEREGVHLALRTQVPARLPVLPSHAAVYPGADRMERHLQDQFGIVFSDHPDERRWTRHRGWPEGLFPLRRHALDGFAPEETTTPPDADYPFRAVQGAAVTEIPVGPIHAGIIEPGHFRFQVVGEEILRLEERLGYVHKGIEKLAEGRDAEGLVRLAGRVSGDSTVAHAWAAAQACERAAALEPPPRALLLRALACERERIANHLGDIGAICNDVGFAFAHMQFSRLREVWLRRNERALGHRLMMDLVVPGGVARDLAPEQIQPMREEQAQLAEELKRLQRILLGNASLDDRLVGTGRLLREDAEALGCLGYVGRASGLGFDLRRAAAYPPYDQIPVQVPVREGGDVAARLYLRLDEIRVSLRLLHELLNRLQPGPVRAPWHPPAAEREGLGLVEGWRGEIVAVVRFGEAGRVMRYFPRDPSWFNWPALERLIHDNIVPDFPVCNKSVNGSYSGVDL